MPYTGNLRWILTRVKPLSNGTIPDGVSDGDIIRWNEVDGAWESKAEPIDLKQINFVPMEEALENTEGGVFYKSTDKQMYVCTEGE